MRFLLVTIAAAFALNLAACNTISGMGKDIERGGEKIQKASK
jgi:predicted small secreted protein